MIAGFTRRSTSAVTTAVNICAAMNPGASTGRIPANVSVSVRAMVTAGLANDVEAVNHYAAPITEATAAAATSVR